MRRALCRDGRVCAVLARIDAGEVCSRRAVGLWAGVGEGLLTCGIRFFPLPFSHLGEKFPA